MLRLYIHCLSCSKMNLTLIVLGSNPGLRRDKQAKIIFFSTMRQLISYVWERCSIATGQAKKVTYRTRTLNGSSLGHIPALSCVLLHISLVTVSLTRHSTAPFERERENETVLHLYFYRTKRAIDPTLPRGKMCDYPFFVRYYSLDRSMKLICASRLEVDLR